VHATAEARITQAKARADGGSNGSTQHAPV